MTQLETNSKLIDDSFMIDADAMDFVLMVCHEAGISFTSHTYFFDFIVDNEKNILSSPPGSGKTIAVLQHILYHWYLSSKQKKSLTRKKIMWAVPMKALAESIKADAVKLYMTKTFLRWYRDTNTLEGTKKFNEISELLKKEENVNEEECANEKNMQRRKRMVEDKIGIIVGSGASHRISPFWMVVLTYEHLGIFITHQNIPFPDACGMASKLPENIREQYIENMTSAKAFFRVIIDEIHFIADRSRGIIIDQIISASIFLGIHWIGISGTIPPNLLKLLPPAHTVNFIGQNSLKLWEYNSGGKNGTIYQDPAGKIISEMASVSIPAISAMIYIDNKIRQTRELNKETQEKDETTDNQATGNQTPRVLVFVNNIKKTEEIFKNVVQKAVDSNIISLTDIESYQPPFSLSNKEEYDTVIVNGKKVNTITAGWAYGILISHAQLIIPGTLSPQCKKNVAFENYKERISSPDGDWSAIIATSTLAVGVNLAPVSHVVVNEVYGGISWSQKELVQMIGRSGRTRDGYAIVIHNYTEFQKTINSFTGYRASMRTFAKYILPFFTSFSDLPAERKSQNFSTFWTPRGFCDERMPDELKQKIQGMRTYEDFIEEYEKKLKKIGIIKTKDTLLSIYNHINKFELEPEYILTAALLGSHLVDYATEEISCFKLVEEYNKYQELLVVYSSVFIAGTKMWKQLKNVFFEFNSDNLEKQVDEIIIDKTIQEKAISTAIKITQQASDILIGPLEKKTTELITRMIYHFSETGTVGVRKDFLNLETKTLEDLEEKTRIIQKYAVLFFNKTNMNFARFLYDVGNVAEIITNLLKTNDFENIGVVGGINSAWRRLLEIVDNVVCSNVRKWEIVKKNTIRGCSNSFLPCERIFVSLFAESLDDSPDKLLQRKEKLKEERKT